MARRLGSNVAVLAKCGSVTEILSHRGSRLGCMVTIPQGSVSDTPAIAVRETIEAYDANAAGYGERYWNVDMTPLLSEFAATLPPDNLRVLDAGCGPGRDLTQMVQSGLDAHGLDLSGGMLQVAHRTAPGANLIQGDLRCLPFESRSFGGVWSIAAFLHLAPNDMARAVDEVARVLVKGGAAFISTAGGDGSEWRLTSSGRRWFHYYHEEELREACVSAGLDIVRLSTDPGVVHGTWINLLARKGY